MPPPFSYDFWQNLWPSFLGAGWAPQPVDKITGRFVDQRHTTAGRPFEWAPELRNARLTVGATTSPWAKSITGIPVQRTDRELSGLGVAVDGGVALRFKDYRTEGADRWSTEPELHTSA